MNLKKLTFDLKISKLQGSHWDRANLRHLALQLLEQQGNQRYSIESRIIVLFDRSPSSSVAFLKSNEKLILRKLMEMLENRSQYWFWLEEYKTWQCIILIKKNEYNHRWQAHQHPIGRGLREPSKAEFETKLLKIFAFLSDGLVEVNENYKEHGIDGWIYLNGVSK